MSNIRTSLVITSYHADQEMVKLTEACLASIKNDRRPDEVIVVDDCSPLLAGLEGMDRYIRRDENGGFPRCANTGWAEAKGDILILSNNDIEYTPGWLDAILEPFNQGYDISSILVSDESTDTKNEIEEDGYFGSLWAQRRGVYEKLGGFDEDFDKGTFEDKDYFVRAKRAGFRIGKNHAVYVKHVGRATMDKLYPDRIDFKEGMNKFKKKHGTIL